MNIINKQRWVAQAGQSVQDVQLKGRVVQIPPH